ncbi:MAG: CSLREA domain-containing protein, partial [Anaerolineales bacterium]
MKHLIFRSLCVLLLLSLLSVGQGAQPVSAAIYDVNTLNDTIVDDNLCSLREAIHAANDNFVNDDCGAISNADDQITFSVAGTIALTNSLPPIMDSVGKLTI